MIDGDCKPITPDRSSSTLYPGLPSLEPLELKAAVPHMLLWIDYCARTLPARRPLSHARQFTTGCAGSTPQNLKGEDGIMVIEEDMSATRSMPSYIERTDLILVMTPPSTDVDTGRACSYTSWRGSGCAPVCAGVLTQGQ